MPDESERPRLMVACDRCGSVYAAVETSDGTLLPMGSRSGCSCGCTDFSRLSADELFGPSTDDPDPDPDDR